MKNFIHRHWRVFPPVLVVVVLWVAWGCNQDTTPASTVLPPAQVTLAPKTDTLVQGSTLPLSATIVGWTTDSTVSWSIIGVGVPVGTTQAQLGSIQCSGLSATYTAPATLTASTLTLRIHVRSNQDTLDYMDCLVTVVSKPLPPRPSILVNPVSATLPPGQLQQFQATVTGSTNTGVRWKLVSGVGTISSSGLYSSPTIITDTSATIIVEAMWSGDSTVTGRAVVTIATSGPCFRTQILPIFISNCSIQGCHNPLYQTRGYDFTTYQGIMPIITPGDTATSFLIYRTNHFVVLTVADRALLAQWILAGAPNSQCNDGLNDCDTTHIQYSTYVQPTIANYCVGCHSYKWAGQCDSLDFTQYSTVAGVAQSGLLMDVIRHHYPLPSMPEWGPQLDSCTISKIADWVNRGAPND